MAMSASERMDYMNGDAPDLNLAAAVKLQRRIVRMGGFQAQPCRDGAPGA